MKSAFLSYKVVDGCEIMMKKIKNEIIDKFAERIRERFEINNTCNMIDINIIAQELKEEVLKCENRYW